MTETIRRDCHRCGREFKYSQLHRRFHQEWDKFIYFCDDCMQIVEAQEERTNPPKNKSDHVNWWDKPEFQKEKP